MKVFPFIILLDPASNSVRYGQAVYMLNRAVLIGIGCVWFALAIACGVHAWQCFRFLRGWLTRPTGTAPGLSGSVPEAAPKGRS